MKRKPKRIRRTKAELLGTAYHEAGHAVVAMELSLPCAGINIRASKHGGGVTWVDHTDAHLLDRTTVRFAGIAAEEQHQGHCDDYTIHGATGDFNRIQDDFAEHRLKDSEARVVWKQCATRATHLVKHNWDAIDRVAKALYKHKRLNIDQLIHLIWVAK